MDFQVSGTIAQREVLPQGKCTFLSFDSKTIVIEIKFQL